MSRSSLELQPVSWSAHNIPHAICSRFDLGGGRGIFPEGGNGVVHQAPGLPPLRPGLPFDGGTAEIVVGVERGARPIAPARPSGLCRTGKAGNPEHEYHPMAQRPRWQRTAKPILSCRVGKVSPGRPAGCGWSHRFCRRALAPEQQPPTRRPPANMQGLRGHPSLARSGKVRPRRWDFAEQERRKRSGRLIRSCPFVLVPIAAPMDPGHCGA